MVKMIIVALFIMFACWIAFVIGVCILSENEKHLKKKDRKYNSKQNQMCYNTRFAGECPKDCSRCCWSLRMERGKIYSSWRR